MAITVTSDQTLFNATGGDAEVITNWTVTAAWSTAPVTDGDMYLQSTTSLSCIGGRASGGGTATMFWDHLTTSASIDLTTGNHVFFWIKCITIPAMDARVRGGIGLSISSGTDVTTLSGTVPWNGIGVSKQWFLTGNDIDTTSGWVCYVVDATRVADLTIGSADMASVDRIGIRANVINGVGAGAFKPKNILWDAIRYGTKLTITGSTGTFQDIYAADSTTANQYGILTKSVGIFFAAGKLVFGTTGQSAPCILTDTKQTIVWQDFPVASGFYEIQLVGNTTPNVTTVTLGTYSGGLTSGGCTIKGTGLDTQRLIAPVIVSGGTGYTANDILTVTGGTGTVTAQFRVITVSGGVITEIRMERAGSYSVPPTGTLSVTGGTGSSATFTATVAGGSIWTLTASTANQTLNLYGCTFSEMLSAALTTTSVVRGCTFTNFGTITTGGALIDNCTFQDVRTATPISATSAMIIASTTQMALVTNCKLINCSGPSNGAIRITTAGSYDFTGLTFSGNTYDIENSSAGVVTINADANSDPTTYINTGGGSTSIISTKTLAVHVEDTAGADIANAQVYIQKTTPTAFTSGASNNAGDGTLVVTQAIDTDIPTTGMVSVLDVSANQVMPYRYASWATSTFTFPTEVTGTADAGGSSTILIDAAVDFTAIDVKEGDTLRNTTDNSWAVVDEINSATQLTTSALQGGSDNTWSAGDTYSFHKLAVTLVSAVDTVDVPLVNTQTDSNGEVSKSYNYGGDMPVQIRVRSNAGATKYIPFSTADTIRSTGLSLNVVLQEDTEAT